MNTADDGLKEIFFRTLKTPRVSLEIRDEHQMCCGEWIWFFFLVKYILLMITFRRISSTQRSECGRMVITHCVP